MNHPNCGQDTHYTALQCYNANQYKCMFYTISLLTFVGKETNF